jgi:hypothetical protein
MLSKNQSSAQLDFIARELQRVKDQILLPIAPPKRQVTQKADPKVLRTKKKDIQVHLKLQLLFQMKYQSTVEDAIDAM